MVERATRPIALIEFSPSGGLFQFAVQLGDALAARGHRVVLLTGPNPELQPTQPGFTIEPVLPTWHPADTEVRSPLVRLPRRVLRAGMLILAWIVLAARLAWLQPRAALWSQWRFTFEAVFVVAISKLLRRSLLGIVAHEPLPRSDARDTSTPKSGKLLEAAFGAAWRRMDVAVVLGPNTRDVVLQHWEPRGDVTVIPHGDERIFRSSARPVAPVADSEPVVLFFGTWTRYKGIDVLLDAFSIVRQEAPEARLVLAGAVGADVDLAALRGRALEIGNVETHAGYIPADEVPVLLESARVVAVPYVRASQSGVVQLAYTFSRPVIASATGDLPTAVADGETGLLVPPGDAGELAVAMLKLLADPEFAARLGEEGHLRARDNWNVAAERICDALDAASAKLQARKQ